MPTGAVTSSGGATNTTSVTAGGATSGGGTSSGTGQTGGVSPLGGTGSTFVVPTTGDTATTTTNGSCVGTSGGQCFVVASTAPDCGDGKLDTQLGEDCDDGNRTGGDGFSGICKVEPNWTCQNPGQPCTPLIICGNGVRQTGENCDDGNRTSGDGCSSTCAPDLGWYCTPSNASDPTSQSLCSKLASCGDGRVTTGETCDLGSNNGNGLGCDANCRVQDGYLCRALPVGCVKRCAAPIV